MVLQSLGVYPTQHVERLALAREMRVVQQHVEGVVELPERALIQEVHVGDYVRVTGSGGLVRVARVVLLSVVVVVRGGGSCTTTTTALPPLLAHVAHHLLLPQLPQPLEVDLVLDVTEVVGEEGGTPATLEGVLGTASPLDDLAYLCVGEYAT